MSESETVPTQDVAPVAAQAAPKSATLTTTAPGGTVELKELVGNRLRINTPEGKTVLQVIADGPTPGMWFANPKVANQCLSVYCQKDTLAICLYDGQRGDNFPNLAISVNTEGEATLQWHTPDGRIQMAPIKVVQQIIEAFQPKA